MEKQLLLQLVYLLLILAVVLLCRLHLLVQLSEGLILVILVQADFFNVFLQIARLLSDRSQTPGLLSLFVLLANLIYVL